MDDHRRHRHLATDPTTAVAYAHIADRHDSARRRRPHDPDDPRAHTSPGPLLRTVHRLAARWRREPTGVIATQVTQRAKKSGAGAGSDLPSLLRC
ncbi:hypothetical protein [Williamsia phyllosphaerae]|uniref:hypothetical protein n=1 Tax=Williamsia phyllosphaerae TaxID=885042 RepID=UPI00166EDA07|nr:hypothetical protein [Williamsia phyllosphaerae]